MSGHEANGFAKPREMRINFLHIDFFFLFLKFFWTENAAKLKKEGCLIALEILSYLWIMKLNTYTKVRGT
jgi:hypothetical protein